MSEFERAALLKNLIKKAEEEVKRLEQDDEMIAIQKRYEEIMDISEGELTEELTREASELELKAEKMYIDVLNMVCDGITQNQILDVLNSLTPQFMKKNNIPFPEPFNHSTLESLFVLLLNNLNDENCILHNRLLANKDFIDVIFFSPRIVGQLLEKTNDEKICMEFINYCYNYIRFNDKNSHNSCNLGMFIESIMNSVNYPSEFKLSLLSDSELIGYINDYSLTEIIKNLSISNQEKMDFLLRDDVSSKLSNYDFSRLIGSLCQTYEDFERILNDKQMIEKIDITSLMQDTKISPNEFKNLIFNIIYEKYDIFEISRILTFCKIEFETMEQILFDKRIFPNLTKYNIACICCSDHIKSEQRKKLLFNDKIYNKICDIAAFDIILNNINISVDEKAQLLLDDRFINLVSSYRLNQILSDNKLDIEIATKILLDKRLFYRLIGEWNDEYYHPNDFYGDKGPYKYDKYEFVLKLYEKNKNLARTFNYGLLKDEILDLGYDFIEKISRYKDVCDSIVILYEQENSSIYFQNMVEVVQNSVFFEKINIELFIKKLIDICKDKSFYSTNPKLVHKLSKIRETSNLDISLFNNEHWKILTEIGLRDKSIYNKGGFYGKFYPDIDITLNILPDVETIEDLDNYTERRLKLCDDFFNSAINNKDLNGAKNAFFNKYFSINLMEAEKIKKMFGTSIHTFDNNPSYQMQTLYVEQIINILNLEDLNSIEKIYKSFNLTPISFDEMIYIDQSLRQMFSKQISDNIYKVNNPILNSEGDLVQNNQKYIDLVIDDNGKKILKKVLVYEPGFDFKMLIHSTDAYGQMQLINNNYFDSWNKSERIANHGICCSIISNDNMGMAAVNDVLFGFDSWDPMALIKLAPYDLYTFNDDYEISEEKTSSFMSLQDITDNTRHTHNELVLERFEFRTNRRTADCQNIQPSYVIIYSDMPDEIKQKAVKCSEEMKIPIVYLDKEKIVANEVRKIDEKINYLFDDKTDLETKLDLLDRILLSHENNRSGLKATNSDWVDKFFPTNKINSCFEYIINYIQHDYVQTGDIDTYYKFSSKILDILERENIKFDNTLETIGRRNYIDISIEEYKKRLIQLVNPNLCKNNLPKLQTIMQTYQLNSPDLPITKFLSSVDISIIHNQVSDLLSNSLYPQDEKNHNIGHIERVMFLSQLIGQNEFVLDNGEIDYHAIDLLTQCAKYHDCGRKNDTVDREHGKKSAEMMKEFLLKNGYIDDDIKIMQAAVEYHEEMDDDYKLKKICEKYGIEESKFEFCKKIACCLKDADALDRTRFKNRNSELNIEMLRFDFSKDIVHVAKALNKIYGEFDKQQFEKICQYFSYQQQMSDQVSQQTVFIQSQDLFDEGGKNNARK